MFAFALVAVFLVSSATPATAATKKATPTAVAANTNKKKAKTLKLNKAYVVTDKKENGYTKFVAPKTAKYVITVSNAHLNGVKKNSKKDNVTAALHIEKNICKYESAKTCGGYSTFFNFASKAVADKPGKKESSKELYKFLAKRSATIKLVKGANLYLSAHDFEKGAFQYQIKITIKK